MVKVLIVDDSMKNRRLIHQLLLIQQDGTKQKVEVTEACNGKEAIEKFALQSFDLIFMDVNMPEMDGYQAATKIKSLCCDVYIPIIFITSEELAPSILMAIKSGGDDFIQKPIERNIFESKVQAHLRIANLTQQLYEQNKQLKRDQYLLDSYFEKALSQCDFDKKTLRYYLSSMSKFNGDMLLAKKDNNGDLYIIIGDFTGHGLTAAMGTLPVTQIFFKMVDISLPLEGMARELNTQLNKLLPAGMFFAATLLKLNFSEHLLEVWTGGLPPGYWLNGNGELKRLIQSNHLSLGVLNNAEFDGNTQTYTMESNDKLYLYSDGIVEAVNGDGEMFGENRVEETLISKNNHVFDLLLQKLQDFSPSNNQTDDITVLEVTFPTFVNN